MRYPEAGDVLRNISFPSAARVKILAFLTGHSAPVKSTLLKLIAIMERCSRGHYFFGGQILLCEGQTYPLFTKKVGFIFQDYSCFRTDGFR